MLGQETDQIGISPCPLSESTQGQMWSEGPFLLFDTEGQQARFQGVSEEGHPFEIPFDPRPHDIGSPGVGEDSRRFDGNMKRSEVATGPAHLLPYGIQVLSPDISQENQGQVDTLGPEHPDFETGLLHLAGNAQDDFLHVIGQLKRQEGTDPH